MNTILSDRYMGGIGNRRTYQSQMQGENRNTSRITGITYPLLIYISGVFLEIESRLPQVTCLSFMDDLGFLAGGNSVIEIKKTLEKAGKNCS